MALRMPKPPRPVGSPKPSTLSPKPPKTCAFSGLRLVLKPQKSMIQLNVVEVRGFKHFGRGEGCVIPKGTSCYGAIPVLKEEEELKPKLAHGYFQVGL